MTVEEIERKDGLVIQIEYDDCPESPREWTNVSKLVCFHRRYNLGDNHGYSQDDFESWGELREAIAKEYHPIVIFPLIMHDHGLITLTTGSGHGNDWDSGQVGWAFDTPENREECGLDDRFGRFGTDCIARIVRAEVETYNQYLNGDVYGYVILDEDGSTLDSCWGFYGLEWAIEAAHESADYEIQEITRKRNEQAVEEIEASATYAWNGSS